MMPIPQQAPWQQPPTVTLLRKHICNTGRHNRNQNIGLMFACPLLHLHCALTDGLRNKQIVSVSGWFIIVPSLLMASLHAACLSIKTQIDIKYVEHHHHHHGNVFFFKPFCTKATETTLSPSVKPRRTNKPLTLHVS